MQTSPVPLGAGTGFALRQDADKAAMLGELRDLFGVRVPDRGIGQARYAGADHARELRGGQVHRVASLRTRGNPYFLYLTRVDGCGVCALVDRKVQDGHFYPRVMLVRLCFEERAFDGTVVDGEMLRLACGRWVFLAGDLRAHRGVDLRPEPLTSRLQHLAALLSPSSHRPDMATDVCFVRAKQYFSVAQLRDAVERQVLAAAPGGGLDYEVTGVTFRGTGPIGEDGDDIVFACGAAVVRRHGAVGGGGGGLVGPEGPEGPEGLNSDEFVGDAGSTVMPEEEPEREFYIRRTEMPDVYELYDTAAQADVGSAGAPIAGVPTLRHSAALRDARFGTPLRFNFSARFGKWVPHDEPQGRQPQGT